MFSDKIALYAGNGLWESRELASALCGAVEKMMGMESLPSPSVLFEKSNEDGPKEHVTPARTHREHAGLALSHFLLDWRHRIQVLISRRCIAGGSKEEEKAYKGNTTVAVE
jgi:hypothetical protein